MSKHNKKAGLATCLFHCDVAKIRSFEAEQAQAHKTTIFSGVSMTVNHDVAGSSPAGGAIFGGQFDNSNRKSLIFKDFFGF